MVFYGTNSKNLKNSKITNVVCPKCEQNTEMKFSVFAKYAHVYWIPFFSLGKLTFAECNSCFKTFEKKEFTKEMHLKINRNNETKPTNTPIWHFTGLALLGILISWGVYSSKQDDANEKIYIQNPKKGDVYFIKCNNNFYSTLRVDIVLKDSIEITQNDYQTDLQTGIEKIDIEKNYTNSKYRFSKKALIELQKKDTIYEIKRP